MTHRWTANLFATDVYRLNANIMALCAAHGLKNEVLIVNNPFHNVLLLIQELSKNQVSAFLGLLIRERERERKNDNPLFLLDYHNKRPTNWTNETQISGCIQALRIWGTSPGIQFRACEFFFLFCTVLELFKANPI